LKTIGRFGVGILVFLAALWIHSSALAQSPFDGTWRTNLNQSNFSPKPIVAFLSEGWYHCTSCNPQLDVKADGKDQPVIDQPYDTISVREINSNSIELIRKKGGRIVSDQTRTASSDGKTLTVKSTEHPAAGGAAVTAEVKAVRIGIAPAGINRTSGSWKIIKVQQSDNALLTTYKTDGDKFTMTEPTGETYTAKFDGNDYPVNGAYDYNTISLKRMDTNTIEETDKRDGIIVDISRMTISPDGKKMTIVDTNTLTDRTSTYIAERQ
jgi:hypothetical protein